MGGIGSRGGGSGTVAAVAAAAAAAPEEPALCINWATAAWLELIGDSCSVAARFSICCFGVRGGLLPNAMKRTVRLPNASCSIYIGDG